jgi:uncharacterized phage-associated protein
MTTALDIAKYFLRLADIEEESEGISNLKLQKLLYYSQSYYLALFDKALFEDPIYAWTHGPVCPNVYHAFKHLGRNPIPLAADDLQDTDLTPDQIDLLNEVYQVYGQFSAWKLRNLTHDDQPWKDHQSASDEIPKAELKAYFKTKLS